MAESENISEWGKMEKTRAGSSHTRRILGLFFQKGGRNLYCERSGGLYRIAGTQRGTEEDISTSKKESHYGNLSKGYASTFQK